jgi:hypothetical protein
MKSEGAPRTHAGFGSRDSGVARTRRWRQFELCAKSLNNHKHQLPFNIVNKLRVSTRVMQQSISRRMLVAVVLGLTACLSVTDSIYLQSAAFKMILSHSRANSQAASMDSEVF